MPRLYTVDFIRATAILLMVFTHTAIFFDGQFQPFSTLGDLGGRICFTFFLFAFGATLPVLTAKYFRPELTRHLFKRAVIFYFLYVVVGVMLSNISELGRIMLLHNVPEFSDFILAFAYFFIVAAIVVRVRTKRQYLTLLAASVAFYWIGYYLYPLEVSNLFWPIKAIFVGQNPYHMFPVLQYLIVMVLGYGYGKYHSKITPKLYTSMALASILLFIAADRFFVFERWQVTPEFLLFGLMFVAVGIVLAEVLINNFARFRHFNMAVSKRASGVLVLHLVALVILAKLGLQSQPAVPFFFLFLAVMFISWWFARWVKL